MRVVPVLLRHRPLIASTGLLALAGLLAAVHRPASDWAGNDTPEPAPLVVADVAKLGAEFSTGALLLDLVEPEDGEGGSEAELAALLAELGLAYEPAGFYSEGEHLFRVFGDQAALAALQLRLQGNPLVEVVEPELIYSLIDVPDESEAPAQLEPSKRQRERFVPDDPLFSRQWHMEMIHTPEAWKITAGKGAIVAVIDTGVAWKDLPGVAKQVPDLAGTAFTHGETFVPGALKDGLDDHLHGTHVAGTIAQTTNNALGVTGVAYESTIMPLKVLGGDGRGSVPGIANAIRYAADHGAQVINMSLGGPLPSAVLGKAVAYAHEKGVIVVCAAGNEKRSRVGYPAGHDHAVAVAAVDGTGQRSWYSNWGKDLDVSAPGGDTREDKNGDGFPDGVLQNTILLQNPMQSEYMWLQGTSMASPHAAGVAALIVSRGVTNPDEVERILKRTAKHPNNVEWDKEYGAGVIDALAAVDASTESYAPERAGLAGLLGLAALAGLGAAGAVTRRARIAAVASAFAGAGLAAGAFGCAPLAYQLATATGSVSAFGSPLILSALAPLLLTLMLLGVRPLRSLLVGINLGYAAMLLHGAIVLPTLVAGLPGGTGVDRLWLAVNAVLALALARRVSRV
ncbi:S8 family peptidase [Nannocystis sp.]|uniref:S8 family peptidase n=1 Tax=Nannocystis sp. TaxID=1962667 RepID=UPI002423887E|nr:S8 family peptidase [Nannocystis sp.]MBK7824639.1 peptidase S8 [Nannocystis sp.]MBK9753110.1 peptidase S8 [Nannocystis sp.]